MITKKKFKELISVHSYGNGQSKRIAVYFDWQSNENGCGFSQMLKSEGFVTKKEMIDLAYEIFFDKEYYFGHNQISSKNRMFKYKCATNDSERFKVS